MTEQEVKFHLARIRQFVDRLPVLFYPEEVPLAITGMVSADPVPFRDLDTTAFREFREGDAWGRDFGSGWFRLQGTVPAAWAGRCVVARLAFGGEACVFAPDGEPLQGLTAGSVFSAGWIRERFPLFDACTGAEPVTLLLEAAANHLFGIDRDPDPTPNRAYRESLECRIDCARLSVFDRDLFDCWLDAAVLDSLLRSLPERSPYRAQLLHGLTRAANCFRHGAPNPADVRRILAPYLEQTGDTTELATVAVGHAHIDTAWLWPMRETVRKCARTFSSQLRLVETYPEYVFGASQPQLYQFVKDHYPALYERIKQAVANGRWEPQGAMWVEADTNLPAGESLVRQLLYGKRFYRQEFGVDVEHLWLPDVFGYTAALPQLLKLAGVSTFLTQKLSWNQFNRFPHHTFRWRGIDGTEVLTHFPPENNYNGELTPEGLRFGAANFEERGYLPEFLTLFGVGDGGGGPREETIEFGKRLYDLPACPKVRFGAAHNLFARLQAKVQELPVWTGELYLELHRGTLTTQALNKKMNRDCELALRRTELLYSCLAPDLYPGPKFETLWKTVLTNQFHDIIPGSSIHRVYEDSQREYAEVLATCRDLETKALSALRADADTEAVAVTLLNPLTQPFHGAVHLPNAPTAAVQMEDGRRLPVQTGRTGGAWIEADIPGLGGATVRFVDDSTGETAPAALTVTPNVLQNSLVRYEFDDAGQLRLLQDLESGRNYMRPEERGNVLTLYEDWPHNWDAWEIDPTYEEQVRERARLKRCEIGERGPYVASLLFDWEVGSSSVRQEVCLSAFSRRLDFRTRALWQECRKMLRVAFPVDVTAPEAAYEIQYGLCRRPTHRNTTWDMAKFEVCGQRFADLSDGERGVALLNNCRYGYKVHERTLDLNLLRAPWNPDPQADRGEHAFTYSLLPHPEPLVRAEVIREAHQLNQPPCVVAGRVPYEPPCRIHGGSALIDAIKKAEDEDAWIVRIYEALGQATCCEISCRDPGAVIVDSNIMEEPGSVQTAHPGPLHLRSFEVRTLLVRPGSSAASKAADA